MTNNVQARIQGTRNQQSGAEGERIARRAMHNLGYNFINPIATPVFIRRDRKGKVCGANYDAPVTGDLSGVADGGISVLAEVKNHNGPTLTYSTLEQHQHLDLLAHDGVGGISLLIWIHQREAYVMRYPIDGFMPRTSIKIEQAEIIRLRK